MSSIVNKFIKFQKLTYLLIILTVLFILTIAIQSFHSKVYAGYACCGSNCVVCNVPTPCPTIINCGPPIQFNCNGLNACGECGAPTCSPPPAQVCTPNAERCNTSLQRIVRCLADGSGEVDTGVVCGCTDTSWGACSVACGGAGTQTSNCGNTRSCNNGACCTSTSPTANTLVSPANGANLPSYDNASLAWNATSSFGTGCPSNNNAYIVFTSPDGSTWTNRGSTSNLTMNLTGLTSGTLYYWRVGVSNGSQTAYSPTWTFRTNSAPTVTYNGQLATDTCGNSTSGRVGGDNGSGVPITNPARYKFTVTDTEGDIPSQLFFILAPRSLSGGAATTTIATGQSWVVSGRGMQATVQIDNASPTASAYRIGSQDLGGSGSWSFTSTTGTNHSVTTSSTQVATLMDALNSSGSTGARLNANTSEYYFQVRFDNNFGNTVMASNPTRLWDIYVSPQMRNSDGQLYMLDQWTRMAQWGVDMVAPTSVITGPSYDASSNINLTYTGNDGQGVFNLINYIIRSDPAATLTDNTLGQAIAFTDAPNTHWGSVNLSNYLTQPSRNYITNGIPGNDFNFILDVRDYGCNFVRSTVNAGTPSPWILSSSNNVSVNQNTVNFGSNRNITIPTITSFSLTGLPGYTYTDGASGPYLSTYGVLSGTSQTIVSPVSKISKLNRYVIDYNNEAGVPRSGTSWYDYLLPIVQSNSSPAMATFATTSETATGNAQFPQGQTYTGNISTIFGLSANGKRNLAVTGNIQLGSGTVCDVKSMIFVSGNLRISPNLTKTSGNACVFVVNGNISISQGSSGGGILVNSATQPNYDQIEATLVSDDYIWADPDNQSQSIDLSATKWASWSFNESSGSTAFDSSGNNRNGTWTGGPPPYWAAGQTGNAGRFLTTNTYVNVGNLGLSGTGSLVFSINPSTSGSDHRIFSQLSGASSQSGALRLNGGAIEVWTGSAWVNIVPAGSIAANTWYRIGVVYSGGSVTGYLNGARMNTASSGFTFSGVSAGIGAKFLGTYGATFSGLIDEFRVYNSALTGDQIATDYFYFNNDPVNLPAAQLTPTPLAHWKLNEGVGTLVSDYRYLSGNGSYQGTLGSQWIAGKYGAGLNFNGTNNYVSIPHRADLNFGLPSNTFTITAWVKVSGNGSYPVVTKARPVAAGSHMPWLLFVESGKVRFFRWCEGSSCGGVNNISNLYSNTSVNNGQWRHVAFVNESATSHKIYIDGVLDITNTGTWVNNVANTEAIEIGRYKNYSYETRLFTGQVDDVKIYSSALTAQQLVDSMAYSVPTVKGEGLYIRGGVITAGDFEWNRDVNGIANAYHPSLVIQSDSIFSTIFKNDLWVRDYSIREQQ